MFRLFGILGSLHVAVPLLVVIGGVLAWGTLYEARFGTASVQLFVYESWWFQALLAFLAVNLAAAALRRVPWQRKHIPFVLAHLGIIAILVGGIVGGRLGVEGQMVIPEGESSNTLRLPQNVLVVHPLNPGGVHLFPVRFEAQAWKHEPGARFEISFQDRKLYLTVDRYLPNAVVHEEIQPGGPSENPAVRLKLSLDDHEDEIWLLARDPDRFGARWGDAHLLFLEAQSDREFARLTGKGQQDRGERGTVVLEFPDLNLRREIPVPRLLKRPIPVSGTPYRVVFKDYFTDLAIAEEGVVNRSREPRNPAVSFVLQGPQGSDPYLLFALHPDFPEIHGQRRTIRAHAAYLHPAARRLPPQAVCLVRQPDGKVSWVFTGAPGELQTARFELGKKVRHPWLGMEVQAEAFYPTANVVARYVNRDNEVRSEAVHVVAQDSGQTAEAWIGLGGGAEISIGGDRVLLEYRKEMRELPFSIQLLDFRKIDYPGTDMAAGFEADVVLSDPERGVVLRRTISMNNPLKYRGYSFFQSSYILGPREATVLSVRKDPGTPLVYAGFLIVVAGVVGMFIFRRPEESP